MNNIKFTATFDKRTRVGERRFFQGAKMFVKTNADPLLDSVFSKTDLISARFKSKAWSRLSAKVTKLVVTAIRSHYNLPTADVSIAFSQVCGCSCPCSPGYNVRARSEAGTELLCDKSLYNTNVYANIVFDEETLAPIEAARDEFFVEYENEKREHNA
jgi:hypothetical protein